MASRKPECLKCGYTPWSRGVQYAKQKMAAHLRDHEDMTDAQKRAAWAALNFGVWPPRGLQ
jgi:hypothetical protein